MSLHGVQAFGLLVLGLPSFIILFLVDVSISIDQTMGVSSLSEIGTEIAHFGLTCGMVVLAIAYTALSLLGMCNAARGCHRVLPGVGALIHRLLGPDW